jgi:4-amino-4-deoxy-L-arabinose transferase-like glycosyltransferase
MIRLLTLDHWHQAPATERAHYLGLATIVLLAVVSALFAAAWGLPDGVSEETVGPWAVDTIAPLGPLIEAYHRFTRAGIDEVIYPLFHYIVLVGAYLPYVAIAFVSGELQNPGSDFPYGATNPAEFFAHLNVIASLVSAAMLAGIVVAAYLTAREAFDRTAALWTAAFTATIPPLSYYGMTSNLDVPYLFWLQLTVWQLLRAARTGTLGAYVLCAVFASLATATKDQAAGFFIALPIVVPLLVAQARRRAGQPLWPWGLLADRRLWLTALAAVLTFALANNLLFGGFEGFMRHVWFADEFYGANVASQADSLLQRQPELLLRTGRLLLEMTGPLLLVLALAGLWIAISARNFYALVLPLLSATYYVSIIAPTTSLSRYLLGMVLLAMPFAGVAVSRALSAPREATRRIAVTVAVAACAWQLVLVANLHNVLRNDSRYAMETWVREHVAPGAVIESSTQARYLPRLSDRYQYRIVGNSFDAISYRLRGEELTTDALHARNPDYVMVLSHSGLSGDPERLSEPHLAAYYRSLLDGTAGYETVARFKTPSWIGYRQITAGTEPETILLKRSSAP